MLRIFIILILICKFAEAFYLPGMTPQSFCSVDSEKISNKDKIPGHGCKVNIILIKFEYTFNNIIYCL